MKKNSEKNLKLSDFIPAIILAFVVSFMLYIFEPIVTYSSSFNDYWFTFKTLITNNILINTINLSNIN